MRAFTVATSDGGFVSTYGNFLALNVGGESCRVRVGEVSRAPIWLGGGAYVVTLDDPWVRATPDGEARSLGVKGRVLSVARDGDAVVAVRALGTAPEFVRFDASRPDEVERIDVPETIPIGMPSAPVRPGRWESDLTPLAAPCVTANVHGVVLTSANGLLWHQPAGGEPRAWRLPAIHGEAIGHAHEGGVVLTLRYPKDGAFDVVWIDDDGIWRDCLYGKGYQAEAVPVGPRFLVSAAMNASKGSLLVAGPQPARSRVEALWQTDTPASVSIDVDARTALITSHRGSEPAALRWNDVELSTFATPWSDRVPSCDAQALPSPPSAPYPEWPYEVHRDPQLGRLPVPDRILVDLALSFVAMDPGKLADIVPGLRQYRGPRDGVAAHVLDALHRIPPPVLSRSGLLAVLKRLESCDEPYLERALRYALPVPIRNERFEPPHDRALRLAYTRVHPETRLRLAAGGTPSHLELRADLRRWPAWELTVQQEDETLLRLPLDPALHLSDTLPSAPARKWKVHDRAGVRAVIFPLSYGVIVDAKAPDGAFDLFACATVNPPVVAALDASEEHAVQRAQRYAALRPDDVWLGRTEVAWVVTNEPELVGDARQVSRVDDPEADALLKELLDLIETDEPARLTRALAVAAFLPEDPTDAARAVEALLLQHDAVEELYGDLETIRARIERVRGNET